jgi:hypothetical protein
MKLLPLLLLIGVFVVALPGCISDSADESPVPQRFEVKEKYSAISRCGWSEATNYYILTTTGEVFTIAGNCDAVTQMTTMQYYGVWSDAGPGDVLIKTGYVFDIDKKSEEKVK